jgi:dUTP pyrophosphatase
MSEKKKGTVTPALPKSVGEIIDSRLRKLIRTPIVADEPQFVPAYQTKGSACCDLRANLNKTDSVVQPDSSWPEGKFVIPPGATVKIDCGFLMEIPPGYEAQIRCRSGWARKGLMVSNGIGTVDEDYRGRIAVILTNTSKDYFFIAHGERIAQMCIKPVFYFDFEPVESLSASERGGGGFGSTGVQ